MSSKPWAPYEKYGLKLGHYVGHGIGTTVNELPWFVPSDETILDAGMVVCIETGAYGDEATGKCEKTFVIREERRSGYLSGLRVGGSVITGAY